MEHTHPYGDILPVCSVLCGREMYHCSDDAGTKRSSGTGELDGRGRREGWE